MSEQINKILASTSQAFSTAEMKQARDNISAQAKLSYAYSGSTITSIDGSAVGTPGALTAVHHDSNLSGSATSGSPLGLYSAMVMNLGSVPFGARAGSAFIGQHTYLYPNHLDERSYELATVFGIMESKSAASIHNSTAFIIAHTANGVGGGVITSTYGGNGWNVQFSNEDNYIHEVELTTSGNHYRYLGDTANMAIYGFGSALFTDNTGTTWEKIDADSIRRWNEPSPYQIKVYKPTTASVYLHTSDYPKFPSTADGTFVIVNLGDGPLVTYPDSLGATANVGQNQSAQLIWDSQANRWVHWNN